MSIHPAPPEFPKPLVQDTAWIDNDIELAYGPKKKVSSLAWSRAVDMLAVSSWDHTLRIYEVEGYLDADEKMKLKFDAPVLNCDWSRYHNLVAGGSADKTARVLDVTGEARTVWRLDGHEEAVSCVKFFDHRATRTDLLATGSRDRIVNYWDLRQREPIGSLYCDQRVESLDADERMLVIGTGDRSIHVVDLLQPCSMRLTMESPLLQQTSVVKCLPGTYAFAVGSVYGGCAIHYLDAYAKAENRNYDLKCCNYAQPSAVNAISFHPFYRSIFSTSCADGTVTMWDYKNHKRVRTFPNMGGSVLATGFNFDGTLFAYALGPDESKGSAVASSSSAKSVDQPSSIFLHEMANDEVEPWLRKQPQDENADEMEGWC